MIRFTLFCAMCGKETMEPFELPRNEKAPHHRIEDLYRIIRNAKWIVQDDVCGDVYCSRECAK